VTALRVSPPTELWVSTPVSSVSNGDPQAAAVMATANTPTNHLNRKRRLSRTGIAGLKILTHFFVRRL
jgi:hypothetical protein